VRERGERSGRVRGLTTGVALQHARVEPLHLEGGRLRAELARQLLARVQHHVWVAQLVWNRFYSIPFIIIISLLISPLLGHRLRISNKYGSLILNKFLLKSVTTLK
jgi:hypothetical protein